MTFLKEHRLAKTNEKQYLFDTADFYSFSLFFFNKRSMPSSV